MITATFENVTFEQLRTLLPQDSLPVWKRFTVKVEITTDGMSTVNLYDRYRFIISKSEALNIITALAD